MDGSTDLPIPRSVALSTSYVAVNPSSEQIHTFAMLMDVYVVSWIFTGGAIFIIYLHHMKKISKNVQV